MHADADSDTVPDAPHDRPEPGRRRRATRLLTAATAAWAFLLGLHLVFTGRWWPWFLLEAVPPLTAVAVPLLLLVVVLWARPVRRSLCVALVLLLLAGAHLAGYGPGWGGTDDGGPRGTKVRVFAWNTNYWRMSDDEDDFYAYLRRQDADVYLLQEYLYWKDDQPVRIDDTARLREEFPGYRLSVQGELLTLSRLPVVDTHHQPFPASGSDWYWHGPKAQRTDIRVGGRVVSFYNVHMPVPFRIEDDPFGADFYRFLEGQSRWWIDELHRLRRDLDGNTHPAVVAGDFNSPWMELSPPGDDVRPHSPATSLLPPRSWPVTEYRLPRLWRLDWLYTTGDLAVPGYRFGGGAPFSDHAAQEIRLVVPRRSSHTHTP
jgi:endonuclease/exonuclease/phosphatase (EEP) superfamily protein YafD